MNDFILPEMVFIARRGELSSGVYPVGGLRFGRCAVDYCATEKHMPREESKAYEPQSNGGTP
ncbi:MAG: hypothetical protein BroJett038_07720 [Chloroflexota bacterium]|nr:MAG: hypothetical protein BroJett038_07720 [Chloroflexota bacterium]